MVGKHLVSPQGYALGVWGPDRLPNYTCDYCGYATLDLPVLLDHLWTIHRHGEPAGESYVLFSADGQMLVDHRKEVTGKRSPERGRSHA